MQELPWFVWLNHVQNLTQIRKLRISGPWNQAGGLSATMLKKNVDVDEHLHNLDPDGKKH